MVSPAALPDAHHGFDCITCILQVSAALVRSPNLRDRRGMAGRIAERIPKRFQWSLHRPRFAPTCSAGHFEGVRRSAPSAGIGVGAASIAIAVVIVARKGHKLKRMLDVPTDTTRQQLAEARGTPADCQSLFRGKPQFQAKSECADPGATTNFNWEPGSGVQGRALLIEILHLVVSLNPRIVRPHLGKTVPPGCVRASIAILPLIRCLLRGSSGLGGPIAPGACGALYDHPRRGPPWQLDAHGDYRGSKRAGKRQQSPLLHKSHCLGTA